MELVASIALPQMEPISQLDPYLNGLNIGDAFESFNRLADSLLQLEESHKGTIEASECAPTPPLTSDWFSSKSSTTSASSSRSFGPASVASSCNSCTCGSRLRRAVNQVKIGAKRRVRAAEKYRQKVRGKKCCLLEQLDQEQERNKQLRRDLEAKLTLYREFINLLASNTGVYDTDLASIGYQSLTSILSIDPSRDGATNDELEKKFLLFKEILEAPRRPLVADFATNKPVDDPFYNCNSNNNENENENNNTNNSCYN